MARWFRLGLSVAGPFVCRCLTSLTMLRFHFPLIEPDVRISRIRLSDRNHATRLRLRDLRERRPERLNRCGGDRLSPISWLSPLRTLSLNSAPSLHRRYPASSVLRASPPPQTARPVPRGRPVAVTRLSPLGFPVLRPISLCRHAVAITPVEP